MASTGGPITAPNLMAANAAPDDKVIFIGVAGNDGCNHTSPSSMLTRTMAASPPVPTRNSWDPTGLLGSTLGYSPTAIKRPPLDSDGTYTLPTGHLGSGVGSPTTPIRAEFRPARHNNQATNAQAVSPCWPCRPPPLPCHGPTDKLVHPFPPTFPTTTDHTSTNQHGLQ
jgi:hypothetical protein